MPSQGTPNETCIGCSCQAKILANSPQPSDSTQNKVFPKVRERLLDFAILKVEPNVEFPPI
jgi:hypothetical protein